MRKRVLVTALWLLAVHQAIGQTPAESRIGATVRYLSALEYLGLRGGMHLVLQSGLITQTQFNCVSKNSPAVFELVLSRFVAAELSPQEQAVGDNFLGSDLGQRLTQVVEVAATQDGPPTVDYSAAFQDSSDEQQLEQFIASSAGEKIMVKALFRRGETNQEVIAVKKRVMQACGMKRGDA